MAAMGLEIRLAHYEIKVSVINMLPSFHSIENEDPYKHLDEFLNVCGMVKINDIDDDALKLNFFSISNKWESEALS